MKLCIDCKHFHPAWDPVKQRVDGKCVRHASKDPVFGEYVHNTVKSCEEKRAAAMDCGPDAKYYEEKGHE